MNRYELCPTDDMNVKSFYRKAYVEIKSDGSELLLSYDTPIIKKDKDGTLHKLWNEKEFDNEMNTKGWSQTTGRHIKAFCGLSKKEYCEMECE